jgi:hypothetical protein
MERLPNKDFRSLPAERIPDPFFQRPLAWIWESRGSMWRFRPIRREKHQALSLWAVFSGAPAPPTKTNELKSVHHVN